jgi:hypothetical protein
MIEFPELEKKQLEVVTDDYSNRRKLKKFNNKKLEDFKLSIKN